MSDKLKTFFTEPLIQFIILGGLLFLLVSYMQKQKDIASREIIIDNNRVGLMLMNYKTQTGNFPNKEQLDAMINNYIKEEISYREAKKIGLDKDDEIIRRRLSQKFDFLQTDLIPPASPTEEALQQFYKTHAELFETAVNVSFSHIYFSANNSTDSIAKQRAITVLHQLANSNLQRAPDKGDRFPLQYDYTNQAAVDIQQNFGDKPILDSLFKAPVNSWKGPVQSGYGWHLIFISKRESKTRILFASIKEDVKTKYLDAAKAEQNKKVFEKLEEKYIINRAYLQTK